MTRSFIRNSGYPQRGSRAAPGPAHGLRITTRFKGMNQRFKGALPRADQATPSNEQKHASRDEMHAFRGSFSICFNGGDPHDPQRGCNSRAPRETIHVLQGSDTAIQGRRYTRCKEGGPQGSPSTMRFGSGILTKNGNKNGTDTHTTHQGRCYTVCL